MQKFIDPKGEHNFTIRLQWSPKLCILEKTINTKKIYDKRFNLYERAVTYDGEAFQTETEAIRGNNLPDRFEKIGSNIASHISNITLERIKIVRMILNFKIGKNDKIYFLWCSSLRIENLLDKKFASAAAASQNTTKKKKDAAAAAFAEIPFISNCDTAKIQVTYPNSINLFQYSNQGKPIKVFKSTLCKNCDNKVEQHKMCDITFRTLVEAHDSRKRDKEYNKLFERINMTSGGVELLPFIANKGAGAEEDVLLQQQKLLVLKNYKTLLMPKVINALYPKLGYDDYKVLKRDTVFLCKNTQVCEKCFLDLTQYCNFSGANTHNVLRVLKSLIPEDQMYIRKDAYNTASDVAKGLEATNNNNNSAKKLNNGSFYNEVNSSNKKNRSKTPGFGNAAGFGAVNSTMRSKQNFNATTGNLGSYANLNYRNNNCSNNYYNSKNKYKPDFSSKIKFIVQPKKDSISNVPGVDNQVREGIDINFIGQNSSNFVANNLPQMSIPSSTKNKNNKFNNNQNNNDYNHFGNFNSSNNNQQSANNNNSFNYNINNTKSSKNNSLGGELNEINNDNKNNDNYYNRIIGQNANEALNIRTFIKKSSLSKKTDSEKSLNLSRNNNQQNRHNNKESLNNSKLASNKKNNSKNNFEESKINENENINSNESKEAQEIDNKIKCEVLEADKNNNNYKTKQNNLNNDLKNNLQAQSNYLIEEKERQHDSESDDDQELDDGHDNQSDEEEEGKIVQEVIVEKCEEEKN